MSDGTPGGGASEGSRGPAPPRVLLVDDHVPNLFALEALFAPLGAETEGVTSGAEALVRLGGGEYAAVLLDVQMPGLDGFETLERLRQRDRVTPVLFVTAGSTDEARVRRAYALGAVDFLVKPLDPDVVRAKVATFLELARARAEARACAEVDAERRRLVALFEHAPMAVCVVRGPDLVYEYANPRYRALTGAHRDLDGRPVREVLPELEPGIRAILDRVVATGERFAGHEVGLRLDWAGDGRPHERFFDLVYEPMRDGSGAVDGLMTFATEVTSAVLARRELEAARVEVEHERDRIANVLETMHDAFAALDRDYRITLVNANHERMSRTPRERSLGRSLYELYPETADPGSKYWAELHRVVERGERVAFEEYYAPLDVWTEVRASPTPEGGAAVFFRDVTARKRLEAEREATLAREQKARAVAESANRMKDEFLATVSHELRTPLNAILGWATLLQGGSLDAPTRARAVETIERNARAQARLIEDLLDLSRILQGKFVLAVGPVELVRVVEAALDAVRPAAEAKGVRLQPVLDSHATIVGDAERLQQIAWNLLANAIKFTPRGGRVRVTVRRAPSYVELSVADTGRGIDPAFLPHVFEPFRQADSGITRRSGGLGLGLSIVRSLVELHGGTVTAQSDGPGQGATFVVRLPMAPLRSDRVAPEPEPAPGAPERAAFECPPALAGLRVLIVDDEPDTRSLLAFVLGQCEAKATAVGSAAEALAELGRARFDVLISDVGMPGEDGLSLIRRVRRLPPEANGRIPAVALTAYARGEDRARALRAGFSTHLAKPIEPSDLVLVVAALVANGRP